MQPSFDSVRSILSSNLNIGVYTDPAHNLYVDEAVPDKHSIDSLRQGEAFVAIFNTGICGYATRCSSYEDRLDALRANVRPI